MAILPLCLGRLATLPRVAVPILVVAMLCAGASGQSPTETAKTAPSALTTWAKKLSPTNWAMPSMKKILPGQDEQNRIIERKDGLMTEVTGSAKNSWQRTKAALNPMNLLPAGNRTPSSKADKPGFFSRLLSPPTPTETPSTVTDFLKQDRVTP